MEAFDEKLLRSLTDKGVPECTIILSRETGSTNLDAKALHRSGFRGTALLAAERQSGGRGTKGRSFSSPEGGIYFSLLIPLPQPDKLPLLTPMAAVAAARAADLVSGKTTQIKWVNDILLEGRKVCGILCEAVLEPDAGGCAIIGVGADVYEPRGGFPDELRDIAGTLCGETDASGMRERFTAAFMNGFFSLLNGGADKLHDEYSKRMDIIGKTVKVTKIDREENAVVLGIANDFRLVVQYGTSFIEKLLCDEVSVRPLE